MKNKADAIVVGGGVVGAAVTFYLAADGMDVLCLERGDLASGSTCACDGDVLAVGQPPGYKSRITIASQQLLRNLVEELGGDFEYTERGSGLVVENEEEASIARSWVERQRAAGVPARYVEGAEVFQQEPLLARDVVGLVECPCDSSLNPMAFVYELVAGARARGAHVGLHSEVTRLELDRSGRICGVEASSGYYWAPTVVVAAGVWSPHIAESAGVSIPVVPRRGHLLVSERTPFAVRKKLMEFGYLAAKYGNQPLRGITPEMAAYGIAMVIEPTLHGNFLLGSSREFAGFDTHCNQHVLELIAQRALRFFPAIESVRIVRGFAGLRPSTPDLAPIVSSVEEVPGLYLACGHEGSGVALAPITGKLVAEMITERTPSVPTEPLQLKRFRDSSVGLQGRTND